MPHSFGELELLHAQAVYRQACNGTALCKNGAKQRSRAERSLGEDEGVRRTNGG